MASTLIGLPTFSIIRPKATYQRKLTPRYGARWQGRDGTYTFEDTLADLYLACTDKPTTAAAVQRKLGLRLSAEAVREIFEEFRQRGLMFLDGPFALALALPAVGSR